MDSQELADLAIFEVTFTDEVMDRYKDRASYKDRLAAVAAFTNNYATRPVSRRFRLVNAPELTTPLALKGREFLAVGYPNSIYDEFLDPVSDSRYYLKRNLTRSLWINKPKELYGIFKAGDRQAETDLLSGGFRPSATRSYRSFMHQFGLADLTVITPRFPGKDLDKPFIEIVGSDGRRLRLIHYGLGYLIDDYAANKGASGSPVIDSNYGFIGIHFAADPGASVGISLAFRSPGFDYRGYYGGYNLEPYDLIYGGGVRQRDSYKDELVRLYGPNGIKTDLFPKGIE